MLTERPQPGAIAVDLEVRPVINHRRAVQREARRGHLEGTETFTQYVLRDDAVDVVGDAFDRSVHPRVIATGRVVLARTVQGVGDERGVTQPAESVLSEIRRGNDGAVVTLKAKNCLDASLNRSFTILVGQLISQS